MSGQFQESRPIERRVLPRCPLDTDVEVKIYSQSEENTLKPRVLIFLCGGLSLPVMMI
jgi:hypothetical protein